MNVESRHLAREAFRRWGPKAPVAGARIGDMLATRFDKQVALITSKARSKAVLCTRRAGKTESAAAYLLKAAQENPGCIIIYVAPTLTRARELMWKPLCTFNARFGFRGKSNDTRLTLYLPNGAEVRLHGADKLHDADKKRGDKVALVIIDEAGVYAPEVLKALIVDVYGPALEDVPDSVLCVMGTPGINCMGKWWDMTRNEPEEREKGWTFFAWSVLDNPHMAHMKARLPELKRERGWTDDNPTYVREWLGRWVNDAGALFYRYSDTLNGNATRPSGKPWLHTIGVDLGHDDAFALHCWAFSPDSRDLYEVESFKKSGLLPSDWSRLVKEWVERYQPIATVVDSGGLGKAFVAEMQTRDALPVEAAEKQSKFAFVTRMNDDFQRGRIHVDKRGAYAAELRTLPSDSEDATKEDERFPNHLCDAALYAWRAALHYLGEEPEVGPPPGSPEALALEEKRMEEAREAAALQRAQMATQDEVFGWGTREDWSDT